MRAPILLLCVAVYPSLPSPAVGEWSVFAPISDAAAPVVGDAEWSGQIDAFVHARLTGAGIKPAPAVDRRTWMRRVTFDLIGLPPAPRDVREFLADPRREDEAMAAVVDRLLASPRYGERWARHWLDVVRYADTDGFAIDEERPWLWRYRDYVIRVFNEDMPFDRFIRQQIAGDELNEGDAGKVALSYYRLGPWEADNMTGENRRQDYLNDITSNVGSALLGLTVGCARCHDHKFDPITQADFYRLQAFFTPIKRQDLAAAFLPGELHTDVQRRRDAAVAFRQGKINELRAQLKQKIADATKVRVSEVSDEQLDAAIKVKKQPITDKDVQQLSKLNSDKEILRPEQRFEAKVVAISNPGAGESFKATHVLNNGSPFDPAETVVPDFLSTAPQLSKELSEQVAAADAAPGGRRKLLAEWLTHPKNPITPRVLVNRIWQYHFGMGIVATANDFGSNGSGPSHPDLLDYLARKLIQHNWRPKPLHREIVLSRAYRTSALHPQAERASQIDPNNRLLWRANLRRLDAEQIRDTVLAASGRLRFEMGGPGFLEQLPRGMGRDYPFFKWMPSDEKQRRRRSIYMFQRRNLVHPMVESFDGADLNLSCERRGQSVTAPQALSLFNSRFAHENSLHLARRLREYSTDDAPCVERLFGLALSRTPTDAERVQCCEFLQKKRQSYARIDGNTQRRVMALRDLALAMFNTNEFVYLD